MKLGNGNSSSGSDSAPSDGNLDPQELLKNLPVDRQIKKPFISKSPTKVKP